MVERKVKLSSADTKLGLAFGGANVGPGVEAGAAVGMR
jgi:hypothetical protein